MFLEARVRGGVKTVALKWAWGRGCLSSAPPFANSLQYIPCSLAVGQSIFVLFQGLLYPSWVVKTVAQGGSSDNGQMDRHRQTNAPEPTVWTETC